MDRLHRPLPIFVALAASLAAFLEPVHAEKPEWAQGRAARDPVAAVTAPGPELSVRIGAYFGERQRQAVRQDHARMLRAGYCPPGLARKGNGCVAPGQARKAYTIGQPLSAGVVYHELPPVLAVQLGAPPAGHRFVRVAADILLIAVGTSMVIDAIEDLGR